jgi:hypothetical protein
MSLRAALPAVVRLCLVVSVVLSGMTFGPDDAEARRGGKFRSSKSHSKPHDDAKHHDDGEATRKSGHDEDDAAASSGGSYVPGVRVRSREASRGETDATTDANRAAVRHGYSPIPAAPSATALNQDTDVPGCTAGMICTVCLAGCDGTINGIVDAEPKTPRPKPRE